jgi:hypothetical protein
VGLISKTVLYSAILGASLQGFIGIIFIGPILWAIPTEPTYIRELVTVFHGAVYLMLFWVIIGGIIGTVCGMITKSVSVTTFWRILWPVCFAICFTLFGALYFGLIGAIGGSVIGVAFGTITRLLMGSNH